DVRQADGLLRTHGVQERQRDRMVAANAQRHPPRRHQLCIEGFDILMALLQAEAAAEGDVADVGNGDLGERRKAMHMMVWTDAFDAPHRAWPVSGARPV